MTAFSKATSIQLAIDKLINQFLLQDLPPMVTHLLSLGAKLTLKGAAGAALFGTGKVDASPQELFDQEESNPLSKGVRAAIRDYLDEEKDRMKKICKFWHQTFSRKGTTCSHKIYFFFQLKNPSSISHPRSISFQP